MIFNRKRTPWRAMILALCAGVLLSTPPTPARAQEEDLQALNEQILENPQDTTLNLAYARAAEAHGKLRLALAAYERVLINDPENVEAQHGYQRIRRTIEPAYSSLRLEVGAWYDSNALDLSEHEESAATVYAYGTWVDERRFGAHRWRTYANLQAEVTPDIDELNYGYASIQTGPFIDLTPTAAAIPAAGAAVSTFGGDFYFAEANASVTVEGHRDSATYWSRLRAGYREYGEDATADHGPYVELMGGVSVPSVVNDNDWVVATPWVRWNGIEGETTDVLNDPIAPGEYTEVGIDASYNYRLNDHLSLSVGALGRDRQYTRSEFDGRDRHDTYVAPKASVTVWNPLSCTCGVTLSYQYRNNNSNDPDYDYDGERTSLSFVRQF